MKLSEISATLTELKNKIAGFIADKATATESALREFSSKLTALESGAVASLSTSQSELATANQNLTTANAQLAAARAENSAIITQLKAACVALSLKVKDDATAGDMVTAIQTAVSSTLARVQVDASKIPAGIPTTAAGQPVKKKSLDDEIKERQAATPVK